MKYLIVGILLLCLTGSAFAQTSTGDAGLILKDIQVPDSVDPGDSFNISFKVENAWYTDSKEIYVYLEGGYPLLNISPTESYYIMRLGYEVPSKTSAPLTFDLFVDESAPAGSYSVDVVLSYRRYSNALGVSGGYGRYREVIPITIEVKGDPNIEVFVKSSTPGEIKSGEGAEIYLEAVNTGTEEARNIIISSKSTEEIDVLWFSRMVYVGDVTPQKSKTAALSIDVDENVYAGEYALPIEVTYESPDGVKFSDSGKIDIPVEESVDFAVAPVKSSANSGEKEKMISFNIQNTGDNLAEEVKATLRASYPFTPTGNEFFIGGLQPGDSATVSFHVDVDSDAASQRYPVDIIIQWEEDDKEYSKTETSFIDVSSIESDFEIYYWAALGFFVILVVLIRIKKKK